MSLEAAIGRIDQILQFQQQIVDPSSSAGASSSAASATGGAGTTGSGASSFADMLTSAQQSGSAGTGVTTDVAGLTDPMTSSVTDPMTSSVTDPITSGVSDPILATGLTGGAGLTATGTGSSANAPAQLQAMTAKADSLLGKPYVWGGGHNDFGPQTGYDCSGFVSAVLHAGGYLSAPQDTQTLPSQPGIESGPGQYVTIYDRTDAGSGEDHVIIDLGGQFYESGGGHGAWGGGGGVERIGTPSAAYLASFNDILHPEGM